VAERLGNTVAVCRKCYIHPAVFEAYLSGRLADKHLCLTAQVRVTIELRPEEAAILTLLGSAAAV
jgi:DNA topoisomerase-1